MKLLSRKPSISKPSISKASISIWQITPASFRYATGKGAGLRARAYSAGAPLRGYVLAQIGAYGLDPGGVRFGIQGGGGAQYDLSKHGGTFHLLRPAVLAE